MTTITIRERLATGPQGENATVSFDNGPLYDITVSDPFSDEQEQQLEWYFEEHLRFPFMDQVKAEQCAKSISDYGETLFKQVFLANPDIYVEYRDCISQGLSNVQVEIAGSPSFHRWHWESLKDPKIDKPLALQATFIRKNQTPQNTKIVLRQSTTINILVVTARPAGKHDVGYRTISRPMVEALGTTNVPVQIDIVRPGTYQALYDRLRESTNKHGSSGYYHIVHFDVHGAILSYDAYNKARDQMQPNPHMYEGASRYGRPPIEHYEGKKAFLSFENAENEAADLVEASELARLLTEYHVPIAILNACQSGKQVGISETSLGSRLIAYGVQMVLAMGYSVTVSAAQLLMKTLYKQLFAKHDLATSIRYARQELYNRKERQALFNQKINLEDWLLPVVYQNQAQNLTVREFTPEEATAYYSKQARREQEQPRNPTYGFVGRDVDILQIEKRLLTQQKALLVRGMGGAGKTTLLHHLHTWWQTTGLVENVFYFGYDERAWNRQQILDSIARVLLTNIQYATFQPLPLDVQQSMLAKRLRSEWHLLILDNLESITGTQLAIQNTLSEEEQRALHTFLSMLTGGKTLVLLGSRGSEEWLADATFDDNIYDLPGLDVEAASMLAERILERYKVTKYRDDPDLLHLLKLLDGFPLALEVILANLAHQTPKQIVEALQAGNIDLDKGDTQKKTESIVLCIEYSHSNLSLEAQQLLLCLAPFNAVVGQNFIKTYIEKLKQQPALTAFRFELWSEVIQEAQKGLLSPDSEISGYLHLQPVLPYFLRNRLKVPGQSTIKTAIETAFREHYSEFGDAINALLDSKEPEKRMIGQMLAKLEYENLMWALNLSLDAQVSVLNLFRVSSNYLDTIQNHRLGLALDESILKRLDVYPEEKLTGELGFEYAGVLNNIAMRYLLLKQYTQAETFYKNALTACKAYEKYDAKTSKFQSAAFYHQLGNVAETQRQWDQAEHYFQQALQIFDEFQDRHSQASTYHQLGIVAQERRQWDQAHSYFQQALQIFVEFQDRHNQAATYHELGIVAEEQRLWDQARSYFQQALQIFVEFQDRYYQANAYHHLGIVAQVQQLWNQAEYYFQQALQIKIEFQDHYGQALSYGQLGRMMEEQQQWKQAGGYFLQALKIFVEHNAPYYRGIALSDLARLWQASGDTQLVDAVAHVVGGTHEEVEEWFREYLKERDSKDE